MRKRGIWVLSVLLMLCLAGCGMKTELRLGTGGVGGTYYAFGNALAQQLSEGEEPLAVTVKTTAGSAANLRLLREGFLQLAIVQSDTLSDAVNGTGVFSDTGPYQGCAALAGLYTEACQIVVPASSDIQTVQDLVGRRVSVGEEESGVLKNAEDILRSHGINLSMLQPQYLSFADAASALEKGEIDAFFCTAGAPTNAITDLAGRMKIRLLSINTDVQNNLLALGNGYTSCVVPPDTYPGQTEAVSTVGVKAVLVAGSGVERKQAAAITKHLLEQGEQLRYAAKADLPTEPEAAVQAIPCAFHAGSADYYSSRGITVETASATSGKGIKAGQD